MRHAAAQLLRFGWLQVQSCLFAGALFVGLALAQIVDLPMARYDALLIYCVALTLLFWVLRLESWREVLVILAFHVIGLGLELFKVAHGSWSYPGDAVTKVAGVPLYAGFMYAAVGSYICQAWRRFELRVSGYALLPGTAVALAIYANFFTEHYLPDARWVIAAVLLVVLRHAWIYFTVGPSRYRMPLAVGFLLIGFFIWIAENMATYLGAWSYPGQLDGWTPVHASKFGSWSLLVTMSFALVAGVKAFEGRLYHKGHEATVVAEVPGQTGDIDTISAPASEVTSI